MDERHLIEFIRQLPVLVEKGFVVLLGLRLVDLFSGFEPVVIFISNLFWISVHARVTITIEQSAFNPSLFGWVETNQSNICKHPYLTSVSPSG
jgi:hypothetical protein